MVNIRQVIAWARANRKYTLAFTVILLVLLALLHPGTRNLRSYSQEVFFSAKHPTPYCTFLCTAPEHKLHSSAKSLDVCCTC